MCTHLSGSQEDRRMTRVAFLMSVVWITAFIFHVSEYNSPPAFHWRMCCSQILLWLKTVIYCMFLVVIGTLGRAFFLFWSTKVDSVNVLTLRTCPRTLGLVHTSEVVQCWCQDRMEGKEETGNFRFHMAKQSVYPESCYSWGPGSVPLFLIVSH